MIEHHWMAFWGPNFGTVAAWIAVLLMFFAPTLAVLIWEDVRGRRR